MATRFPEIGELFLDRYEVQGVLGAGGMSRVYGAVQRGIDRKVAIKVLAPTGLEQLTDVEFDVIAKRFEREAQIVANLRSPHTMVMYDYGQREDLLYMILEYVEGTTLHTLVEKEGAIAEERVAVIARQALASLAEAHDMGILHRDIKPQNIMVFEHLGNPDYIKVLDFGIAKAMSPTKKETQLTAEQAIVGTPSYMSPEQILGAELAPSSDIYSLGLVLYELLFGVVAIDAESSFSTLAHHLSPNPTVIPDDGRISEEMRQILSRMITKPHEDRYQSALELLEEFELVFGSGSLVSPRTGTLQRAGRNTARAAVEAGANNASEEGGDRKLYATAIVLGVAVVIAAVVSVALILDMMEPTEATEVPAAIAAEEPVPEPPSANLKPVAPAPVEAPELEPSLVAVESAPAADEPEPAEAVANPPVEAKAPQKQIPSTDPKPKKPASKPEAEASAKADAVEAAEPEPARQTATQGPTPKKFEPVAAPPPEPVVAEPEPEPEKKEPAKASPAKKKETKKTKPKVVPPVYSF